MTTPSTVPEVNTGPPIPPLPPRYIFGFTFKTPIPSQTASADIELACYDASCAPPPVGKGGSSEGKSTKPIISDDPDAQLYRIRRDWKGDPQPYRQDSQDILNADTPIVIDNTPRWDGTINDREERRFTNAARLLDEISTAPFMDVPLYRGLSMRPQSYFATELSSVKAGDKLDWPPSGFSSNPDIARRFVWGGPKYSNDMKVLVTLQQGSRAFDMQREDSGEVWGDEAEYAVAGSFEVVSVETKNMVTLPRTGESADVINIVIRQTDPISIPDGMTSWSEKLQLNSTTASALIELACHDASCAPPPVGTGGSKSGGSAGADPDRDADALVLAEAADQWKRDPLVLRRASTERLRGSEMSDEEISRRRSQEAKHFPIDFAEPDPIMDKKVSALLNAIADAPAYPLTLYRGVKWYDGDSESAEEASVMADTAIMGGREEVGDILDWGPSGFSSNSAVAHDFSTKGYTSQHTHNVIYKLEEGAKAFSVDDIAIDYEREEERVVAGTFEVTGVEDMGNHTLVSIRQTEPLGSPPGGGKW